MAAPATATARARLMTVFQVIGRSCAASIAAAFAATGAVLAASKGVPPGAGAVNVEADRLLAPGRGDLFDGIQARLSRRDAVAGRGADHRGLLLGHDISLIVSHRRSEPVHVGIALRYRRWRLSSDRPELFARRVRRPPLPGSLASPRPCTHRQQMLAGTGGRRIC